LHKIITGAKRVVIDSMGARYGDDFGYQRALGTPGKNVKPSGEFLTISATAFDSG
jgi:hypothetical protein